MNGAVMYGAPPFDGIIPELPVYPSLPHPQPPFDFRRALSDGTAPAETPTRALIPCAVCKRHIVLWQACPFCFTDAQIAKLREELLAAVKAVTPRSGKRNRKTRTETR